jgi:hypothetical protein
MNNFDNLDNEKTQIQETEKWTLYKAGWRPALGWLSVLVVFYAFILHPSLVWYISLTGLKMNIPVIDAAAMINLVAIVIGVGAMRTYEKVRYNDKFGKFRRRYSESEEDDIYN